MGKWPEEMAGQEGLNQVTRRHELIRHYIDQGNLDAAEAETRRDLKSHPDDAQLHFFLALILTDRKQFREATRSARAALRLEPEEFPGHLALSLIHMNQGRNRLAEEHIIQAIKLDLENPSLYYQYAQLLYETGHLDKAADLLHHSLALDPEESDVHSLLAMVLAEKGNAGSSQRHGRRGLAIEPEEEIPHLAMGITYLQAGRPFKARRHLREALRLSPGAPGAEELYLEADKSCRWIYLPMYYWTFLITRIPGRQFTVWALALALAFTFDALGQEVLFWCILLPYITLAVYTWFADLLVKLWLKWTPPR